MVRTTEAPNMPPDSPPDGDSRTDGKHRSTISRRSYLRAAGAATTAAVSVAGCFGRRIKDGDWIDRHLRQLGDEQTLKLPGGTYRFSGAKITADNWTIDGRGSTFDIRKSPILKLRGDNWSFGNIRFDVNEEYNVQVRPRGGPWRLHNLAWDGKNGSRQFLLHPQIDAEGETGTVEHCWFGSGTAIDPRTNNYWNESAIKGMNKMSGDLVVKGCYFWQNGAYIAPTYAPYAKNHTGRHVYRDCYAEDCYLGYTRIGTPHNTSLVENCVGVFTGDYDQVPPTETGQKRSRGPWIFWGEALIRNCHLSYPGEEAVAINERTNASARVEDCEIIGRVDDNATTKNIGHNPQTEPPEGCVTSAEEAVMGIDPSDDDNWSLF
jgi:hypothetical protein